MSKTYDQFLKEQKGGTAVFTFGRFNPPTTGHEKLLKVLMNTASKQRGDYYVFMSHSQDKKKNPLSQDQKMMFMKLMFPKHRSAMIKSKARNALEALVLCGRCTTQCFRAKCQVVPQMHVMHMPKWAI